MTVIVCLKVYFQVGFRGQKQMTDTHQLTAIAIRTTLATNAFL